MPKYNKLRHSGLLYGDWKPPRGLKKFQAKWRGYKTRKNFIGNQKGYLTRGRYVRYTK